MNLKEMNLEEELKSGMSRTGEFTILSSAFYWQVITIGYLMKWHLSFSSLAT